MSARPPSVSDPRPDPIACLATPTEKIGSIADEFRRLCKTAPARQAVHASGVSLTYGDLDHASRDLAGRLLMVASPDARVGIYARRGPGLVVAMLAVTRAGMTFAVLDAAYPGERVRQMAAIFEPDVMISSGIDSGEWRTVFPGFSAERCISIDQHGRAHSTPSEETVSAEAWARVDHHTADIAYLLFTSGTTGMPKCIATGHAPLKHFVEWYRETFRPSHDDRFSLLSGLGHDPVLRDIFVPLSIGAEIRVPEQAILIDPDRLARWLDDEQITFMHATPPLLKLVCAGVGNGPTNLAVTHAFSGGDALPPALALAFRRIAPRAKVVNFYGTTETPQAVAYHVFSDADTDAVPVGTGIRDTQLLIVTERGDLASIAESGQIAVRSRFLSQGYLGQAAGTARAFVASPFSGREDDTIYLTGDYGFYRADGEVVLQCRADDQVKIRGYRVELAEVNRAIEAAPSVRGAVTLARRNAAGENTLVAFVSVDDPNDAGHTRRVRDALAARLPTYMVPARFLWLQSLPLLPNGKVDRATLVASLETADAMQAAALPQPEADSQLARQWRAILGVPALQLDQSFIEMGGDSLSYVQAGQLLERHLGFVPDGWDRMPFRELSRVKPRAASRWHHVGGTILIRAISILAIVLNHFDILSLGEATPALFVLAGWSFAKFQMRKTLESGSVRPILRSAWKILLPTALAAAYATWSQGRLSTHWFAVLGISNYFPIWMGGPQGGPIVAGFWFVDVLVQIFALLAVLFAFRRVRDAYARQPFRFAMLATLATMVAGVALRLVWDTRYMNNWVPHFSLWMVFLGMAMQHAQARRRQLAVLAAACLALATGRFGPFSFICVAFALFVERVRVPAVVAATVTMIAASSLYIYITHQSIHEAIHRVTTTLPVYVEFCGAVSIGILIQLGWNRTLARLSASLRLTKPVASRTVTG